MRSFSALFAATAFLSSTARAADLNGAIEALNGLGLTSLTKTVTSIASTPGGQRLVSLLQSNASTITLFAPTNDAFAGVKPEMAADQTFLQQVLAYHVVPERVDINSVPKSPDNAIYPTVLNDTSIVKHFGSIPQYIGLVKRGNTTFVTYQNNVPCVVLKTVEYQNIVVHVVSTVIDLPPSLVGALTFTNYTWTRDLSTLVKLAEPLVPTLAASKQFTLFAPTNKAFATAIEAGVLSDSTPRETINAVLSNHIVNGTIIFTGKDQMNYTSAGGEALTFGKGGSKGYVVFYNGKPVANVVQANIITESGVVHIIDTVLQQTETDAGAASSAYSSYEAAATSTAPPAKRTLGNSRFFRS